MGNKSFYFKCSFVVYSDKPFHIEHVLAAIEQALKTFQSQDNKRAPQCPYRSEKELEQQWSRKIV